MEKSSNRSNAVRGMWRAILWGTLALLLVIPALTMDWSAFDVAILAALLGTLGIGVEVAMRFFHSRPARLAASAAVLILLLVVWAELAVGVLGTPFGGS